MARIEKIKIAVGVFVVEIAQAKLSILCGCPADAVKHLKKRGIIDTVEKDGFKYETGPNAILLSEVLVQNGQFSNLTEFPVLQMLYFQGMILPNHPNNNGERPILIGLEDQVRAQMEYIYRGNYGLVSKEEMMEAGGISEETANLMMKIKLRFAFGKIIPSESLVDAKIIRGERIELKNEVFIERTGFNIYEISYKDEKVLVDLNLAPSENYEPPYKLSHFDLKREYFAVIHSGEGDGWDIDRPCMASIIMHQGKIYLVDAGPNIQTSLNYLGISINEIEGIFHSHAHDDHFSGLTTLARCDNKIKYFSTSVVKKSVAKKWCALMSIDEVNFENFFDVHELPFDKYTNVGGLEVMPVYSPHPVETNIFFFRSLWDGTFQTYGHFADQVSFDVLSKMVDDSNLDKFISTEDYNKIISNYLTPVKLKKLDIGGGLIHGNAEDFVTDTSKKIILAHTSQPLNNRQKEIGSGASFGQLDVLISANRDYLSEYAEKYLKYFFPGTADYEMNILMNCPIVHYPAGITLIKKGVKPEHVYLLLTGSIDLLESKTKMQNILSAGSLIGFYSGYAGTSLKETYRAASNISVLQIPVGIYREFIMRNNLFEELKRLEQDILFLENTWLFGEISTSSLLMRIAHSLKKVTYKKNEVIVLQPGTDLHLIQKGEVEIWSEGRKVESLSTGGFFSVENLFFGDKMKLDVHIRKDATFYTISSEKVIDIPIVYWKLLETFERRYRSFTQLV
jgi:hemerythrin